MALSQMFPTFEACFDRFDLGRPIPRSRPAVPVEFRSGGDLRDVVALLTSTRNVIVNAAPASGKSTVLPIALAEATDKVVFLVLPFVQAAAVMHDYLKVKAGAKVEVAYVEDVLQPYPSSGLCVTSAAQVVARWMQGGEAVMPECFVLHDESHESGAASAMLRAVLPTLRGVECYATMSATGSLEPARRMEAGGSLSEMQYERSAFQDPWSVEEDGAPWSCLELEGHVMVFEDDTARAAELMQAYNYNGVAAYRLHSGSPPKDVLAVYKMLHDPRMTDLCALIVDSTYRSGYTFPVSTIVDSGVVRRMVVEQGTARVMSRNIYEYERVQTSCRGGRIPGLRTSYWRPADKLLNVLCDLEQTDVEALALICRVLGFRPPTFALAAKMASGPVPRDVCAAVRGHLPLACMPEAGLELRTPTVPSVREVAVAAEAASAVSPPAELVPSERDSVASGRVEEASGESDDGEDPQDVLASIFSSLGLKKEAVALGQFCAVEAAATSDTSCTAFPCGADSVFRVLSRGPRGVVHASWSDYHRSVALNALVNSHNVDLLQWRAWVAVLKTVRGKTAGKDPSALRTWVVRCAEEASRLASRVESTLGIILEVAEGHLDVTPIEGLFGPEENRLSRAMLKGFETLGTRDTRLIEREGKRVRGWLDDTTKRENSALEKRTRVDTGGAEDTKVKVPAWLAYTAGYTGNPRIRVERIGNGEEKDGTMSVRTISSSSSGSSGRRKIFTRG